MTDSTSLIALIVALIALVVAVFQLMQQLLATGYVIRKCDRVVSGGVTRGGTRKFHWKQFRFTVKYQAITFAFPMGLYESLGVSPATIVEASDEASKEPRDAVWRRAQTLKSKRTTAQGAWVSFVQDMLPCLQPSWVGTRWESGDRIPDDLTVAPAQVDILTIMLLSVASGLQLSKYSPATGEISMSGALGALTSSEHPILGGLVHYTPTVQNSASNLNECRQAHADAVGHEKGVWANAVFGKFNDRSWGRGYMHFKTLRSAKLPILRESGWPEDSYTDTIGGAAGFMALGFLDVYKSIPPTCVRRWSAHFAEMIVKAHLAQINAHPDLISIRPTNTESERNIFLERNGCSSPFLNWSSSSSYSAFGLAELEEFIKKRVSADQSLLPPLDLSSRSIVESANIKTFEEDPSTFLAVNIVFDIITYCDQAMYSCRTGIDSDQEYRGSFIWKSNELVAKAISSLAEAGAPSWGQPGNYVEEWPKELAKACQGYGASVSLHAKYSILRSAYATVMMRMPGELGPGLVEDTEPVTALAYLA